MSPPIFQQIGLVLVLIATGPLSAGAASNGSSAGVSTAYPWVVYGASVGQVADPIAPEDAAESRGNAATLDWWQNAKFGLFINWGPSSMTG